MHIIHYFSTMLGQDSADLDYEDIKAYIEYRLARGDIPRSSPEGHTPLMLYVYFHITDQRVVQELQKGKSYITSTVTHRYAGEKFIANALICAVATENINALNWLFQTGYFTEQDKEVAAFEAGGWKSRASIAYFRLHKVNLFRPADRSGATMLHLACVQDSAAVVSEVMASNPSEQLLSMRVLVNEDSTANAYGLAKSAGHQDCVDLLKHTKTAVWHELRKSINNYDVKLVKDILNNDENRKYILAYGDYYQRYLSLIGIAAIVATQVKVAESKESNANAHEIYQICNDYLSTLTYESQTNALLLGIASCVLKWEANSDEQVSYLQDKYYKRMLLQLEALTVHFSEMKVLRIIGLEYKEDLLNYIHLILESAAIEEIDLSANCCAGIDFNVTPDNVGALVSRLLTNTSLLKCNIQTLPGYSLFCDLVNKVIERNTEMATVKSPVAKEKIYNYYVLQINKILQSIRTDEPYRELNGVRPIDGKSRFANIEEKGEVFSLQDIAVFELANNPKFKLMASEFLSFNTLKLGRYIFFEVPNLIFYNMFIGATLNDLRKVTIHDDKNRPLLSCSIFNKAAKERWHRLHACEPVVVRLPQKVDRVNASYQIRLSWLKQVHQYSPGILKDVTKLFQPQDAEKIMALLPKPRPSK